MVAIASRHEARWLLGAAFAALLSSTALAQHDGHAHQALGRVHFPVTCSAEAQPLFDEGMKLQHSFWYQAAADKFRAVLARDPSCVMAHWGYAMAQLNNPFSPPTPRNLAEGLKALEQAMTIGARTERERGYLEALLVFYRDHDTKDHRTRVAAYEKAMEGLAARFPDDPEARIFYALALNVAASPTDKTYAKPLKAAEILEAEWTRQPEHPGVAHYLVHTYDFPSLAERGLTAAERYAEIAPDAPHALHMPSHIFTRVGRWEQSVAMNARSAEAARKDASPSDELHAYDYMVYAQLQLGQVEAARRIIESAARYAVLPSSARNSAYFGLAAMPARFVMERGAWDEAAALTPRKSSFPYTEALTHFARAVAFARAGKPEEAGADIAALKAIAEGLRGRDGYWAEQVDIQRETAEAWAEFARGRREAALDGLRQAADRESRTEKHVITPGPLAPARELLAEMLLELDRPADAFREFLAVQKTEPNRFRAVYGAARAAELAGDPENAKRYYMQLTHLAAKADTGRPEIEAAKRYLAN
ncbi:hypothetical protein [Enterovirga aerilata]|uniref:Tetratricopeptide repeat protein n=1 Tax=Enterovirga aerilata TaxID=2730920 RepID=A0A849I577_9HYPH|nr:hypothetical protein [Enterovirga sp. DB1703]NNM71549.1 hypothetical protein [Enterovirga sp. DB1703]